MFFSGKQLHASPNFLVPVWILCVHVLLCVGFLFFTFFGASGPDGSDPIGQASVRGKDKLRWIRDGEELCCTFFGEGKRMGKRGESHDRRKRTSHVCAMWKRKGQKKPDTRWRREVSALSSPPFPSWLASSKAFSFSTLVCCTSIGASRSGGSRGRASRRTSLLGPVQISTILKLNNFSSS